jgi:hypothetical protein
VEGWTVAGTEDGYAAQRCVDVELAHGTSLFMLAGRSETGEGRLL